jgi:hypothetical protein
VGSKASLSNGKEGEELIELVDAFQRQNNVSLEVSVSTQQHKGRQDLCLTVKAWNTRKENGEVPQLDLGNVQIWFGDYKTLMGAFTRALYAMDFHLALREYESAATKS